MRPTNTPAVRIATISFALAAIACSGPGDRDIEEYVAPNQDSATQPTDGAAPQGDTPPDDAVAPVDDAAAPVDDAALPSDGSTPDAVTPPACGAPPTEPPSPKPTSVPTDPWPMLRHWERPKIDKQNIALTFDDGPNPSTTNAILDTLKARGIRATFFVNTRVSRDLRTDVGMQETLKRIVAEGHYLGNHTANHYDLRLASTDVDAQLRMVEEDVKLAAPCAPPLTLVRAPYGEPYLSSSSAEVERIAPIVAKHGVHVAWAIETRDFTCSTPQCVVDRVLKWVDMGRRGTLLLHDTQPHTAEALPTILDALDERGVTYTTVEKLIQEKYGKTSAQLLAEWRASH